MIYRDHQLKVLVISCELFPGHETRNLRLAIELISRGYDVTHTGPSQAMADENFSGSMFPASFEKDERACRANTRLFSSWRELRSLIDNTGIVLFGTSKHYLSVSRYAHEEGKIVIQHQDASAMHKWSAYKPDLVSVRSVFDRERMEHFGIAKKEAIHITGSVGSDDAAEENQKIDRDELCKKYGLKSSKKICVFMSSGPALHTEEVKKYYVQICDIINQIPDFNLLIKPHPREYLKEKQHTRYENNHDHTWEQLAPGIPVCDAEDKFDCLRHCDVLVSQGLTSTFIETALLHKPIIYVAIPEGYVQARGIGVSSNDLRPYISNERFTLPGRKVWHELGCLYPNYKEILPPGPLLDWAIQLDNKKSVYFPTGFPEYIGSECSLDELYEVLSSGSYQFNDSDVYDKHIAEFSYANDGKAYKRLADVVDLVEQTPAYSSKIVRLYRSRWFRPVRRIGRIVRTLPERIA